VHFFLQPYTLFTLILPLISFISCTFRVSTISILNLAIFFLLLKPATQKDKMGWNSSTMSSRLRIAPVAVPVELWSLPLFHFAESRHSP
jgi:hypothetical protein